MIHHGDTEIRSSSQRTRWLLRELFLLSVVGLPCWSQQHPQGGRPIEVRDLVDGATKQTNKLVTVQGCLVTEFEIVVLQPCDVKFDQFSKYSVWLDDILRLTMEQKQAKSWSFLPAQSHDILKNGRGNLWRLDGNRDHPPRSLSKGNLK